MKFSFFFFMIPATWLFDFQMVLLFYMSFSSACLFSIRQLRELLSKMQVSTLFA